MVVLSVVLVLLLPTAVWPVAIDDDGLCPSDVTAAVRTGVAVRFLSQQLIINIKIKIRITFMFKILSLLL